MTGHRILAKIGPVEVFKGQGWRYMDKRVKRTAHVVNWDKVREKVCLESQQSGTQTWCRIDNLLRKYQREEALDRQL